MAAYNWKRRNRYHYEAVYDGFHMLLAKSDAFWRVDITDGTGATVRADHGISGLPEAYMIADDLLQELLTLRKKEARLTDDRPDLTGEIRPDGETGTYRVEAAVVITCRFCGFGIGENRANRVIKGLLQCESCGGTFAVLPHVIHEAQHECLIALGEAEPESLDPTCEARFLGDGARCVRPAGHVGQHRSTHDAQWGAK